jgi:RNase H-fold protein (predicted Holliday junction resolvase)
MKSANLNACNMIISEKLSLQNYLHDAIDFHAIRQLMIKSRHKILMPTLVLALTKTKHKKSGKEYKTSFARNIHERTDRPVFTIDDAVAQLKVVDDTRSQTEKAMDDFFLCHLPADVMQQTQE